MEHRFITPKDDFIRAIAIGRYESVLVASLFRSARNPKKLPLESEASNGPQKSFGGKVKIDNDRDLLRETLRKTLFQLRCRNNRALLFQQDRQLVILLFAEVGTHLHCRNGRNACGSARRSGPEPNAARSEQTWTTETFSFAPLHSKVASIPPSRSCAFMRDAVGRLPNVLFGRFYGRRLSCAVTTSFGSVAEPHPILPSLRDGRFFLRFVARSTFLLLDFPFTLIIPVRIREWDKANSKENLNFVQTIQYGKRDGSE